MQTTNLITTELSVFNYITIPLFNLVIAEELISGIAGQGAPVGVVYLDFSKAFGLACHCLLINKMATMGIHLKITRGLEEFVKNSTFRMKASGPL